MAKRTETKLGLTYGWKPGDGGGAAQTPNWRIVASWMQATVISIAATPPPSPAQDARYLVAASGTTGAFAGHENELAWNDDGVWRFLAAKDGYKVEILSLKKTVKFDSVGGLWKNDTATISELDSELTYSGGQLSQITYSDGTTKDFYYTDGRLTSIMWVREVDTVEKTFTYDGDNLTNVTVVVTPNP